MGQGRHTGSSAVNRSPDGSAPRHSTQLLPPPSCQGLQPESPPPSVPLSSSSSSAPLSSSSSSALPPPHLSFSALCWSTRDVISSWRSSASRSSSLMFFRSCWFSLFFSRTSSISCTASCRGSRPRGAEAPREGTQSVSLGGGSAPRPLPFPGHLEATLVAVMQSP